MAWTTPETGWSPGDIPGASDLNEIGANLNYLFTRPSDYYRMNEAGDKTSNSTSFADVDSTLSLSVTPSGGDVLVGFSGCVAFNVASTVYFDIDVNGTRQGLEDGILTMNVGVSTGTNASFTWLIPAPTAGVALTIKLQWKVSGNTITMWAGAGTLNRDVHPQFWAREV